MEGIPGSPGKVVGVTRIVLNREEFGKLKKGEILVAPLTTPVWTPLFALAGGLVTEAGGILSHGAIVAREYGIPAVMSVPGATKFLKDGQRVTVDGSKGLIHLEMEA
jgi:phosphoenolpyruvate synthase/pyruvate phosphate dikinase